MVKVSVFTAWTTLLGISIGILLGNDVYKKKYNNGNEDEHFKYVITGSAMCGIVGGLIGLTLDQL